MREVGLERDLAERLALVGRALDRELAVLEDDVLGGGLEQVGRDALALLDHLLHRLHDGASAPTAALRLP